MTLIGSGSLGQFRHFFFLAMCITLQPVASLDHFLYVLCPNRILMTDVDKERGVTRHPILSAKVWVLVNVNMNNRNTLARQPFQRRLGSLTGTAPCRTEGHHFRRRATFTLFGRRCGVRWIYLRRAPNEQQEKD